MIYFIQDESLRYIKIGFTDVSAEKRLKQLQTGNPSKLILLLSIPGDEEMEDRLHDRFATAHVRGEWFRPIPALIKFIAENGAGVMADPVADSGADWLLEKCAQKNPAMNQHRDTWRWRAMKRIAALYLED